VQGPTPPFGPSITTIAGVALKSFAGMGIDIEVAINGISKGLISGLAYRGFCLFGNQIQ
jgi:hypothetical protein